MAENTHPAFEILRLQLDAMLGLRRVLQEMLEGTDANIERMKAMAEGKEE